MNRREARGPLRKQVHAAISFHGDGAVAIDLDFEEPLGAIRQIWDRGAVHWLDEFGFSFRRRPNFGGRDFILDRIHGRPEVGGVCDMNAEKKRVEAYMLAAARKAGVPIPSGETPDEEPDFRFNDEIPPLGIELCEVQRPASSNHGILPVEQESFHKEIITQAQHKYYDVPDAMPVHVSVYFTNTRGGKRNKGGLAVALTEFVRANVHRASPFVSLYRPETPDGFDSIVISPESSDWWCGEGGGYSLDDIRPQLAARIRSKDELVPTYRANLPAGARVWLLLYSGVTVARSMMIPHGIEEWKFSFRFDRVFWFTALEGQFAEIQRAEAANTGGS